MERKKAYNTDRELAALRPADHGKHYDVRIKNAPNLMLRVGSINGKGEFWRTFVFVSRFGGAAHPTRHAFGRYPDFSLERARKKAQDWRALIDDGKDPRDVEKERQGIEKQEADQKRDRQFGVVIEEYISRHLKGQRRAEVAEYEIRKEIVPKWKNRPINEITRADVVSLVEAIVDRDAPYHAHNILGHIRTFFNWCIDRGKYGLEGSPCDRLKPGRLIGEKKPRQRVLSDDELRVFWRATGRLGYPYGPLFRLLAVTGQRKSEVAEARWSEFPPELVRKLRKESVDWAKVGEASKIWTVPPERFKSDAEHMVPLSADALGVLATVPHFVGKTAGDYLFSTTNGRQPVNGFSKAKARLDRRMLLTLKAMTRARGEDASKVKLPDFVLHDIRRTVRTRLSSLRVSERIAEMVIGHARRGLARVYDQHEFADEMREALDAWAGRLHSIVSPPPSNVIQLRGAGNG